MNVELTPDQQAFVRRAIEHGQFSHEEEAVQEAEASLSRGEGRPINEESMKELADEAKQRFRRGIAVAPSSSR